MDRDTHYNDEIRKSFSERLGEANIMPDGLLQAIDNTDLAILAIEKGAEKSMEKEGS